MNSSQREDPSTEAVIEVTDSPQTSYGGTSASSAVLGQSAVDSVSRALQTGYSPTDTSSTTIVNTVQFSYSSDVTQLGDPFSVIIPDPRGRYRDKFKRGQTVKLSLCNPNVDGGALTLKALGIITNRVRSSGPSGTRLELTCADLGWHLLNCDAPPWFNLQEISYPFKESTDGYSPPRNQAQPTWDKLLKDPNWIHPSWGIRGYRESNEFNRLLKQRLNQGRAQAVFDLQLALGTLTYIQVEPGDKIADHLAVYARRNNCLLNVSCDGYLQIWRPDYTREALFSIEYHDFAEFERNKNSVLDCQISDSIDSLYTEVNCIWEQVGGDLTPDPSNQNFGKGIGSFVNEYALPFFRRHAFSDGDLYNQKDGNAQALWRYNKGVFDSFQIVYTVKGHWQKIAGQQRAYWWESDQMCSVNDTVNGIHGNFYVASVRCDRDERGDLTVVTLRKPCLQANFGEYKQPNIDVGSIVDKNKTTKTAQHVKVTP